MQTILILAMEGVMDSSLAITLDTLQAARELWRQAGGPADQFEIRTLGHRARVRTGQGLELRPDILLKDVNALKPAWVIVPGLGLHAARDIGARLARPDALAAVRFLRRARQESANLAASCAAVFLLAEAGLLESRAATTTWWLAHAFRARHPTVVLDETRMVVRDGRCWTAGSAFSQMDLVLAVIHETMGPSIAHQCACYLVIDQRPSQARYMIPTHIRHDDPVVVAAERWIDEHLAGPVTVVAFGRCSGSIIQDSGPSYHRGHRSLTDQVHPKTPPAARGPSDRDHAVRH